MLQHIRFNLLIGRTLLDVYKRQKEKLGIKITSYKVVSFEYDTNGTTSYWNFSPSKSLSRETNL